MFYGLIDENENELLYNNNYLESVNNVKGNNFYFYETFQDFNKNNNTIINEEENDYFNLINNSEHDNFKKDTYYKSNLVKEESKENIEPNYYSINKIIDILSDDKFINIRNKILSKKNSNNIPKEKEFSKEKNKNFENDGVTFYILIKNKEEENNLKKKRGRKTNKIINIEQHGKMCPDNIIKKIKAKLFQYLIDSINNLINNSQNILLKLDYRFINRLNREQDLKYLKMPLKDLISNDISPRYFPKTNKDYNKKKIEYILKNEVNITIKFMFNITFGEWLDIFTLKKNVRQIAENYFYLEKDIDFEKIEKSFISLEELLNKISNNNSEEYFTLFVFYLYNYERWFYIKNGRNRQK